MFTCSTSISSLYRPIPPKSPPSLPQGQAKTIKSQTAADSILILPRRDLLLMMGTTAAAALCTPPPALATSSSSSYPINLDGVVRLVVARPVKSRSRQAKEEEEEVLVISGIEFDGSKVVKFDVYVNDDEGLGGPRVAEFAGSLVNTPHGHKKNVKTCLRLGITDLLDSVGADDDDSILVTLVPQSGPGLVTINNIGIEFL